MADQQDNNPQGSIDPSLTAAFGSPVFLNDKSVAPYQKFLERFPQFEHVDKQIILGDMHKNIAPEIGYEKFEALAQQPDGWKAIQNAKSNLTEVEKFRQAYPQFQHIGRDDILGSMYRNAVASKSVNPNLTSLDEYKHHVDPLPGTMNDLWNLWEGIKTASSEATHSSEAGIYGGYQKWLSDEFYDLMNLASSRVDVNIDNGKVTFNAQKGTAGTVLADEAKTLGDKIDGWVAAQAPGFLDIVKKMREIVTGLGLTAESQERMAAVDQARSQQATGAFGEVGKVLGSAGTDLALNWPLGGALAKGFSEVKAAGEVLTEAQKSQMLINKSAAFLAATYQSASKYHEAQEAHHENALLEGLGSGFAAPMTGFLYNSGSGRIATGFMSTLFDAGFDETEDIINGRPTNYYNRVSQTALDFGLGALIGGHVREPLLKEGYIPPAEFESHRPLSAADVLGGEEEGYPSKIPARSPLRIIERKERRIGVNLPGPEEQPPPQREDVLARGRPLTRQVPLAGERGIRLLSNQLRLNIPDIDQTLQSSEGLEETISTQNVITIGKETLGKRVIGVRPNLAQQRIGYSDEVWEQVMKAIDAREDGDIPKAGEALDTATSLMSQPERTQFHKDLIDTVKGESKFGETLPERLDDPRADDAQAFFKFDQEFGFKGYNVAHAAEGEKGGTVGAKYVKDVDPFTGKETLIVDPNPEAEPNPHEEEQRAETQAKTTPGRRRVNRGELGAIPNPAQLILEAGRKVKDLYDDHWKYYISSPERFYSEEFQRGGAMLREADIQAQSDELFKERMQAHAAFNPWSGISQKRRSWWNHFNNDVLKQILIDQSNRVRTRFSGKLSKYNDGVYMMGRRYQQMRDAQAKAHLDFDFEPDTGEAVRSMVADSFKKQYDNWLIRWKQRNPGRELPELEEIFDRQNGAKVFFKNYNPEDWLQAQFNQTRRPLNQIQVLRLLEGGGMAIRKLERYNIPGDPRHSANYKSALEGSLINREYPWQVIKAPNNEAYYVEPGAARAYRLFFDAGSIYHVPGIGMLAGGWRNLKSFGSNILTWSLFHPMHIARIYLAHAYAQASAGAPLSEILNPKAIAVQFGGKFGLRFTDDPVIDYFNEKVPRGTLSDADIWWLDKFKRAGLNIGINQERQMQIEFGRSLAESFRTLAPALKGTDRVLTTGIKLLQGEFLQRMAFGEWIPRIKAQAFRQSVLRLINAHPEITQDWNRIEFNRELAKIGDDVEDRFGERNMNNLLWPRFAKELGMSSLLSLGWTMSFLRINGGALKDLAGNATHMRDIFRQANDPEKRKFMTDRINFLMAYTTMYLTYNALNSWFYGYSRGKKYEPEDLIYPIIGEDKNFPATDPHRWVRGRTGEFQSELLTAIANMNHYGVVYGLGTFGSHKINPGAQSFYDAMIAHKDFFGKGIGYGDITEPEWRQWADKMSYILFNDLTPITVKQQIQSRVGHPAPTNFAEAARNVFSPDTIPGILGVPRAPEYVYRSRLENDIVNTYTMKNSKLKTDATIERGNWINEYRLALESNDQERADKALQVLEDKYKVKKGTLKQVAKEALRGTSSFQYMFQHGGFSRAEQEKLLERATPEERQAYEPLVSPE